MNTLVTACLLLIRHSTAVCQGKSARNDEML